MKKFAIGVSLFAITATALTSCASYSAAPLNSLPPDAVQANASTPGAVSVTAKAFGKGDCRRYLDRDVLSKGYQPVQLFIQNNSDKPYLFSLNRISLSCARAEEVADKVHTSTVGRVVGYGVGALILWPLAIPAIVDGVKSASANDSLDSDFASKTAKDQIIYPFSHTNALIFVPRNEFQSSFKVTLVDQKTNEPKEFLVTAR